MADLTTIVVGDTGSDIEVTITKPDKSPLDLTNSEARLFVRGLATGDKPETETRNVAGCTWTTAAKTLTRASGSFTTDGVTAGMLVIATGIADGTYVKSVDSALQITLSEFPTANGTALSVRFWNGMLGVNTSPTTGKATFQSVGGYLALGGSIEDQYRGRVRVRDTTNGEITWTDDAVSVVEFKAVLP